MKERKVFGQFLVSVVSFLLVLLFCLFCLSQKFPSLFFVFFALLFETTNSFQPARTSTKEIHTFIFLGLFRDFKQPKPVSFCLSLPLFQGRKEERIHNIIDTVTPSPLLFFLINFDDSNKKVFRDSSPSLSLSFSLSLSPLPPPSFVVVIAIIKKRRIEEKKTIREEKILSTRSSRVKFYLSC